MPAKLRVVGVAETFEKRPVVSKGRKTNIDYRVREHPTETEMEAPGRTEGVRKIAKRFGVDPGTVQRISRPFESVSIAA